MPVAQQATLNLASLVVNDVYIVIAQPQSTAIQGIDTGVSGVVGGGSWGPLNTAVKCGSIQDLVRNFGPVRNQPNDLVTDGVLYYQQGAATLVGVRVADGTEVKATGGIVSAAQGTVTIGGTFQAGDIVNVTLGGVLTSYTVLAGDTNLTGVATAVAKALNNNPLFANLAIAQSSAAVVTIISKSPSNTTTLVATVTGTGPTITATASGATLTGGGSSILTLEALYTGLEGNNLYWEFTPGNNSTPAARTWTLRLSRRGLAPDAEEFPNIPEASISTTILTALANGLNPARPESGLMRGLVAGSNAAPAMVGAALSGGVNGDTSITTSQLLGSAAAIPATGMYALKNNGVQHFELAGSSDSTAWTSMNAFAQEIGALAVGVLPSGISTSNAVAAKKAAGIDSIYMALAKDWCYFNDTQNNVIRLATPAPFIMGLMATQLPSLSPGNKGMFGILNTTRTYAKQPYNATEMADLISNGILFITNPIPRGSQFGLRHGKTTSSNNAVWDVPHTRMTNFIAYSLNNAFGEFIDELQTTQANDPLRARADAKLRNFLTGLRDGSPKLIEDFSVDLSFGDGKVNTKQSVEQGFLRAAVKVKYQSVVYFFVVELLAGKTVTVSAA
jgi:hypothetical protein